MKKLALIALLASSIGSITARAQPTQGAAAIVQFDKGRALMKEKKYAEACDAFEKSQQLDPQAGTQYNLATCQVQIGKLATAWATFRDLAQVDPNPKRKKDDAKNAAALEPRLPHLTIVVASPAPPGLVVTLDGADVTAAIGTPSPIDLGEHEVRATAKDRKSIAKITTISEEGVAVSITIALQPDAGPDTGAIADHDEHGTGPGPKPPHREAAPVEHGTSHRRLIGGVVAIGGVALAGVGLFFGSQAKSEWNSAKDLCPGTDHRCANLADYDAAKSHVDSANSKATLSTGFVIAGGVAVIVGGVLFLTGGSHESHEAHVSASATRDSASLVYLGRF